MFCRVNNLVICSMCAEEAGVVSERATAATQMHKMDASSLLLK